MIGIYLSGTGNTKHCVEKLVNLIDDKSKCVPLEFPQIIDLLKEEDVIFLGYPTQFLMLHLWYEILLRKIVLFGKVKKFFV